MSKGNDPARFMWIIFVLVSSLQGKTPPSNHGCQFIQKKYKNRKEISIFLQNKIIEIETVILGLTIIAKSFTTCHKFTDIVRSTLFIRVITSLKGLHLPYAPLGRK